MTTRRIQDTYVIEGKSQSLESIVSQFDHMVDAGAMEAAQDGFFYTGTYSFDTKTLGDVVTFAIKLNGVRYIEV